MFEPPLQKVVTPILIERKGARTQSVLSLSLGWVGSRRVRPLCKTSRFFFGPPSAISCMVAY